MSAKKGGSGIASVRARALTGRCILFVSRL